jgi:chemotaxis protein methyltransferase CheR
MAGPLTGPDERPEGAVARLETCLFVDGLYRRYGVDFRAFEPAALERRLQACAQAAGVDSISALQGRVLREPQFARQTMRHLSASASPFLSTPQCFMAMRCAALPLLRSASWPVVWLAECGDPGLVIQMAVMLEEEGLLGKTQLFVTSANDDLLGEVEALAVAADSMPGRDERHLKSGGRRSLLEYCVREGERYKLRAPLRQNIVWGQYDLASDASFNEFHLIVCQRPLKEFDPALQRRTLGLFAQSLCNFGILQVEPPSDVLGNEFAGQFTCLLGEQGVYRRLP